MFFATSARHNSLRTTFALGGIGFLLTLFGLFWLQTHLQPAVLGRQLARTNRQGDLTYICLAPEGPCYAVGSQLRSAAATEEPIQANPSSTDFVIIEDIAGRSNDTERTGTTNSPTKTPEQPVFEDDVII